jgi:hypothetical protein
MTEKQHRTPDLTRTGLILRNSTRIGDSIAVLTLMRWIDERHGRKRWFLVNDAPALVTLASFMEDPPGVPPLDIRPIEAAPDDAEFVDEVNLWVWNDVWYQTGHGITLQAAPRPLYPILFAPLLEADYSIERIMHPRFVLELAERLAIEYPGQAAMLFDSRVNTHDLRSLAGPLPILIISKLTELVPVLTGSRVFIGGDSGLSHVVGAMPHVRQIALHDRENTEQHNETEFDHLKKDRETIAAICDVEGEYRSTPNKHDGLTTLFFDDNGNDGRTLGAVMRAVNGYMEGEV